MGQTDKVKCSSVDGSAAVTTECTCGYKTTTPVAAVGKFCWENTDGKGYVFNTKACTDTLVANQAAACTCGTGSTAVASGKVAKMATDKTCAQANAVCATKDGSAVSTPA